MKPHILTIVFTKLRPRLLEGARSILSGYDADAKDALQDAFCRLWANRRDLIDEKHAIGMSVKAVRNAAIDKLRRRRLHADPVLLEDVESDDTPDSIEEIYEDVDRIIRSRLSERERRVLDMRDRQGFEFDAIAERMNLTEANVRVILSRARRTVRDTYMQIHHPKANSPQSNNKNEHEKY